ncbi:MAG TPA: hypothetical protein V6D14_21710 [Coleofasciculaceae cyanobacterium]
MNRSNFFYTGALLRQSLRAVNLVLGDRIQLVSALKTTVLPLIFVSDIGYSFQFHDFAS